VTWVLKAESEKDSMASFNNIREEWDTHKAHRGLIDMPQGF